MKSKALSFADYNKFALNMNTSPRSCVNRTAFCKTYFGKLPDKVINSRASFVYTICLLVTRWAHPMPQWHPSASNWQRADKVWPSDLAKSMHMMLLQI